MQIVINISDDLYRKLKESPSCDSCAGIKNCDLIDMIVDGIALPKGHGRLCDLDAALKCVDNDSVTDCDAKWQAIRLFEWAMAKRLVIEADKAETE